MNALRTLLSSDVSICAKSPTHALTANPVIDHFGWHTDSWVRSSKYAQTLQQLVRNVDRARGYVSSVPNTLHIPISTQVRPGDSDS